MNCLIAERHARQRFLSYANASSAVCAEITVFVQENWRKRSPSQSSQLCQTRRDGTVAEGLAQGVAHIFSVCAMGLQDAETRRRAYLLPGLTAGIFAISGGNLAGSNASTAKEMRHASGTPKLTVPLERSTTMATPRTCPRLARTILIVS